MLAQYPQPYGQLAISSGQVEADQFSHFLPFLSSSVLCSLPSTLSLSYSSIHPPLLHSSPRDQRLHRGLQKPDGTRSCVSVCVCMLACLLLPRQLTTGPPELRGSAWAIGTDKDMPERARHFHACTHPRSQIHTHTALITTRLLKFKYEPAVTADGFCWGECGGKAAAGHAQDIHQKYTAFYFFFNKTQTLKCRAALWEVNERKCLAFGNCPGAANCKCTALMRNIFQRSFTRVPSSVLYDWTVFWYNLWF